MTDQEAYLAIEEALRILRDACHWGKITIEVNEGRIRRINLTTNIQPKKDGIMDSNK